MEVSSCWAASAYISNAMEVEEAEMRLFACDSSEEMFSSAVELRNTIIGNQRQKEIYKSQDLVQKLFNLLKTSAVNLQLQTEIVVILGSMAIGHSLDPTFKLPEATNTLVSGLDHSNLKFRLACLQCLTTIVCSTDGPKTFIYQDPNTVTCLLGLVNESLTARHCVATILYESCQCEEHQNYLHSEGTVQTILPLLTSNNNQTTLAALRLFGKLSHKNHIVSSQMQTSVYNGVTLLSYTRQLLSSQYHLAIRSHAAKCFIYWYRASAFTDGDPILKLTVMSILVKLCKKDRNVEERATGAQFIGYLTEASVELQRQACITDQLLPTLASYLRSDLTEHGRPVTEEQRSLLLEMALMAFASLGACDEDLRKKILTEVGSTSSSLMQHVLVGLREEQTVSMKQAALRCLLTMSRSVHQLRTTFQDCKVWEPLFQIVNQPPSDVKTEECVSAIVCNLLLEFSPSKEHLLSLGIFDFIVSWCQSDSNTLRYNGAWALMNMTFKVEQATKNQIMNSLGMSGLLLLLGDEDHRVILKTLGVLRNLLQSRPHVDYFIDEHGQQTLRTLLMLLEKDLNSGIKEQVLCVLGNIASGEAAKDYLMENEPLLKKILSAMIHPEMKVQTAAVCCFSWLVSVEEDGAVQRQYKLKTLGARNILDQLQNTPNPFLLERVQFILKQMP